MRIDKFSNIKRPLFIKSFCLQFGLPYVNIADMQLNNWQVEDIIEALIGGFWWCYQPRVGLL